MSSIKERLEAKARRKVLVPIAVEDVGGDQDAVDAARQELLVAQAMKHDSDAVTALKAKLVAAEKRLGEHFVHVEFQAAEDVEYERIRAAYLTPKDAEEEPDVRAALPELAAACAVDEDLREHAWWEAQLARPEWSHGERVALFNQLVGLNNRAPDARIPFG